MSKTLGGVSAVHVSKVLATAGFPRADEPRLAEVSGFCLELGCCQGWDEAREQGVKHVVTVRYQDYDYDGDYGNRAREAVHRICEAAFNNYAAALRKAGYVVEDWMRYDGVRLGLFVTGRA